MGAGRMLSTLDILRCIEAQIEEAVKNEILKEAKVLDITEFSIVFDNSNRELTIDFTLETTEGTITGGTTI